MIFFNCASTFAQQDSLGKVSTNANRKWHYTADLSFTNMLPIKEYYPIGYYSVSSVGSKNDGFADFKLYPKYSYALNFTIGIQRNFCKKKKSFFSLILSGKYSFINHKATMVGEYLKGDEAPFYFNGVANEQRLIQMVSLETGVSYSRITSKQSTISFVLKVANGVGFYTQKISYREPFPLTNCQNCPTSFYSNYIDNSLFFLISGTGGINYLFKYKNILYGPNFEYSIPIGFHRGFPEIAGVSALQFYHNILLGITLKY